MACSGVSNPAPFMLKITIFKVILGSLAFAWKLILDHNYTCKKLKRSDIKYKSYEEIPRAFCSALVQAKNKYLFLNK